MPTEPEILRIKAYLVVQRNVVRDYLDVVALADHLGTERGAAVLTGIDSFYQDRSRDPASVLTAVIQRLSEPAPRDHRVIGQLTSYKGLSERWQSWPVVVTACHDLADAIVVGLESS